MRSATLLRVLSWNLLRRVGARVEEIAQLVERKRPDLVLLQEATPDVCVLPSLVGGTFYHQLMQKRVYGLAIWSPHPLIEPQILTLPMSSLPGRVPRRIAQIVRFRGIAFANVHLSHGQLLNRLQLLHIAAALEGPAAIIGDFNSVGPTVLAGFKDVGPRSGTHRASKIVALRLDRCLARSLHCVATEVLDKGQSDHHPIVLDLVPSSVAGKRRPKKKSRLLEAARGRFTRSPSLPRGSSR